MQPERISEFSEKLNSTLHSNFGLELVGAPDVKAAMTPVERDPSLAALEQRLVEQLKEKGRATYPLITKEGLPSPEGIAFTEALGPYALIQIRHLGAKSPSNPGLPAHAYATVTPDTSYTKDTLRIAYIGRKNGQSMWIPSHLEPKSDDEKARKFLIERQISYSDVMMYLSAANQMALVGDHTIAGLDPQHLMTAMGESNQGTLGSRLIEQAAPEKRAHAGDVLEQQERRMLPVFSAQNPNNIQNDLVWAPLDFTRIMKSSDQKVLPLVVVLDREHVDVTALINENRIVPDRANLPHALEDLQGMGYATLLQKNLTDDLMKHVEKANLAGQGAI